MKTLTLFLFLSSLTFIAWTCSSPNKPPPPITPPDTTSHNFAWQVTYVGDGYSSLSDVFAINDTDVWAVGQLYKTDSTGKIDTDNPYNAVHWDGKEWQLLRIPIASWSGRIFSYNITSVFAFDTSTIWMFSDGGGYARWNRGKWVTSYLKEADGSILRIFGFSNDDIYFSGSNGAVTHWDGKAFTKQNSGSKDPYSIIDIYGTEKNGIKELWAIAQVRDQVKSKLLKYTPINASWQIVWSNEDNIGTDQPYRGNIQSIYPYAPGYYFIANEDPFISNNIYEHRSEWGAIAKKTSANVPLFPYRVRGSGRNNVFVVGDRMMVTHYNGDTWKLYRELMTSYASPLVSLSVLPNSIYAVGYDGVYGVILAGKRNPN